jgi:hypothetical protein
MLGQLTRGRQGRIYGRRYPAIAPLRAAVIYPGEFEAFSAERLAEVIAVVGLPALAGQLKK